MTYQGSKEKLADQIVPILERFRAPGQVYWEPFVGSASIIEHMGNPRFGTDAMTSLIMLWNEVINDDFIEPATVTRKMYLDLMAEEKPSALQAYVGFFWSFSGMYNKGYSPTHFRRSQSFHKMRQRARRLRHVVLRSSDYRAIGSRGFLIYCDPPYRGTTVFNGCRAFNHDEFYEWCLMKHEVGNRVVVSEYEMPPPFVMIAEFPASTSMAVSKRDKERPERLYTLP